MGILHFFILIVVVFLIGILNSSVDGYIYFRNGRLGKKLESNVTASTFERWFPQKLDHFNPHDEREWQHRYFVNDEFFDTTSRKVAFLLISGEAEATPGWMRTGIWHLHAQQYKAILFQVEHRYYGQSRPTEDTSTENLVYLTSQQALADLAFFIEAMNKQYNLSSDVKWIVFGGSYAGSLAAWMRLKYPHLVHGVVSSSGPLLAQVDFPEFFQVVQEALRGYSKTCADAVEVGISQFEKLLLDAAGRETIKDKFQLCDEVDTANSLDVSNLYQILANYFGYAVQYAYLVDFDIYLVCNFMNNRNFGEEYKRLSKVNQYMLSVNYQICLDHKYDHLMAEYRNTSFDAVVAEGGRQWFYQTCTEFGFYATSTHKPLIFGDKFDLDFFLRQCQDIFGPEYNKTFLDNAADRTNALYGGLDFEESNVLFVHGSIDPWHVLGITQSKNNKSPAILIEGAAHCSDMYDNPSRDTPQQATAKAQIKNFIASLLN